MIMAVLCRMLLSNLLSALWTKHLALLLMDRITQKKNSNNLKEIVIFHGGLFGEDKIKMYANADAYILPSHGEGLPMTILEAWSWKLPVVMTPQCNIPEGFEANAAIRIEDNVSSIKQGLQTLFNMSDEERISMGNRGYKLVSENFTWDASAQKMIMLYKWLTNQGEKPDFVYE